jgi:hypothetical protein
VIPRNIADLNLRKFKAWLNTHGGHMLPCTNTWEVVRYRRGGLVSIIYRKSTGQLTYTGNSGMDYKEFAGLPAESPPAITMDEKVAMHAHIPRPRKVPEDIEHRRTPREKKTSTTKIRQRLIERDGYSCWYCGHHMALDDRSIEHLLAKSNGGTDNIANLVLAHKECNRLAGNKPVSEKVAMRRNPIPDFLLVGVK